jgi:Protein of unknown function (DUF2726)
MAFEPMLHGVLLLVALGLGVALGVAWQSQKLRNLRRNWPRQWNLTARPLFTAHERALYRDLRLALPNHVVLSKVGLLRFCQSASQRDAKDWYERLQALNVTFAVCTQQGVVVSVVDMAPHEERKGSRTQKIKEATLLACRVRYVRCMPGQWPQPGLMAAWVLGQEGMAHSQAMSNLDHVDPLYDAGHELARKLKQRRAERAARWAESSFSQDSFFATDSRFDASGHPGELDETPHPGGDAIGVGGLTGGMAGGMRASG